MVRSREYILIGSFIVFLSLTPDSFAAGFTSGNGEVRIQKCHFRDGSMQVSDDPILLFLKSVPIHAAACTLSSIILCGFDDGYMVMGMPTYDTRILT